uniref:Nuclear pore complex protein Nup214 n=1 Tax=Gasterosteus aculeatus aculeatus TaxID=481459 RepID=G3PWA7_GASAC
MSDDTDSPPEREMKDFQFRQMKKTRVFDPAEDLPRERSSLLTISNKFGLTFVGLDRTFKVYQTRDILTAHAFDGKANEIALAEVTVDVTLHHLALSCDELTLSACGVSEGATLSITFYDVRTFVNKARPQKLPFASLLPAVAPGTMVQDLKWNPGHASMLAACLSDGRMMILDVTDTVRVHAELPASNGITCICWSPKGKQVAAGKMNSTFSQYTPALEEKKTIPCPHFYTSDQPVKVLDVLWLRTFVFAVAYAAADGSLETPPELVLISLPKKDEKVETKYLNFSDTVYGSCTERQHHYFLSHVEDWDVVFAASAAAIEVSVIAAKPEDKTWELWILEDASRAELPVTETNEDTLPLGLAIDFTSQQEIHITDEKILPPAPTMLMLSTEGLLCPFALLNLNPGVKQLVSAPAVLALEGERAPKPGETAVDSIVGFFFFLIFLITQCSVRFSEDNFYFPFTGSLAAQPPKMPASFPSALATFPTIGLSPAAASTPAAPVASSFAAPFSVAPAAPASSVAPSSSFSFSVPTTCATSAPPPFSMGVLAPFASGSLGLSFTSKAPSDASSAFSFTPSVKPAAAAAPIPTQTPQSIAAASPSAVKLNLNESVKALEKQLQQKKDSDPIMAGILEEIAHFQKELDDLKARSARADFKVGAIDEMKELRKESEDFHIFTLEIKETTESLHGDIGTLKTTLLEGFAGAEEAKAQSELSRDRNYRQLLYKKPLDPRSEEHIKEIRRLYQYVTFAVEDVNDVLDVEWEKHLEKKKKQKHMAVPGREGLFTTLANNLYIINQQKNRLEQLVKQLTSLRLYNKTAGPTISRSAAATESSSELESLRDALLKARLDTSPLKTKSKSPVKFSPVKQSQLRNFLSKGQMPPVRSTAPANLSRSAFLSPKYYEDLDDVSSSSSLSQSLEPHPADLEEEDEEELLPEPLPVIHPSFSGPRHPAVVRTPSIHPGFGAIQSTPLAKIPSVQGLGFGLIPTNKISLCGADSTALATKTVKHGAPPSERSVPVTIPAQQAAATAALRRQLANQKTALVGTSLTESTLKTVPQVVNVQELKDKGPPKLVSNIVSKLIKFRSKLIVTSIFSCRSSSFSFASVTQGAGMSQVKDVAKFSFGGKLTFGQNGEEPFALTPKSVSPALGGGGPALPPSASGDRPASALRVEPQPLKTVGGETLGSFSGLRVGHGEEGKDPASKPAAASFAFGEPGLCVGKGAAQFSFASGPPKAADDSTAADLSRGAASGSLFKPPEPNPKQAFSIPQSSSAASAFGSLLAASPDSSEDAKVSPQPSEPTPPPDNQPAAGPAVQSAGPPATTGPAADAAETPAVAAAAPASTPAPPPATAAPAANLPSSTTAPTEAATPAPAAAPPAMEPTPDSTTTPVAFVPPAAAAAAAPVTQVAPAAFQPPGSDKPVPFLPNLATTAAGGSVFGQPASSPAPSAPAAPASTGFGSAAFGTPAGTGFGKSMFGQVSGFGQPAGSTEAPAGFSFGQSAFGGTSNSATTGGGVFGAATATDASSFSFGTSSGNAASSTGSGLFGQTTAPAFGQSSGFGQGSAFGSNTTTSSSTGFGFGQPSGDSSSSSSSSSSPSSGGTLFGLNAASPAASRFSGGGFFTGLGGKPSEDAANKNPFGTSAPSGGFGQPAQTGANTLFGSSSAKTFGFGQSSFGEQKASGTFSTGAGSVASQGFGSFSSPTKTGGFGSAPVFGSPPSFGSSQAFGSAATFGSSPSFPNNMVPSAGKVFGEGTTAANMGGFGFAPAPNGPSFGALANQSAPSFGAVAQQGAGFGSQPSSFSGFGQQPQAGGETTGTLSSLYISIPSLCILL